MFFDRKLSSIMVAVLLLVLSLPVWAGNSKDDVTVKDIKQETQDVIKTLDAYADDQQAEAIKTAKQALQRVDERINRLEDKVDNRWDKLSQPAREETRAALRELRQERVQLAEWYGSMKESSQSAWSDMRHGFNKAYKSMSNAWQNAQQEFDQGNNR